MDALMADARRLFDVVVVWRFDRFARSVKQLILALEEFRAIGVEFISHQEALDTSTPMGRAIFTIIASIAELERNIIRELRLEDGCSGSGALPQAHSRLPPHEPVEAPIQNSNLMDAIRSRERRASIKETRIMEAQTEGNRAWRWPLELIVQVNGSSPKKVTNGWSAAFHIPAVGV